MSCPQSMTMIIMIMMMIKLALRKTLKEEGRKKMTKKIDMSM